MAKRASTKKATKPTVRTTITKSRKGGTTRTTTTRSTYRTVPRPKKAVPARRTPVRTVTTNNTYVTKKSGHGGLIAGIIIIIVLLIALAYYLTNPILTPAQQLSQFENQLATLQNNNQNLTNFYLATAPSYGISVNKSWAVEVTDEAPGNSTPVGQLTISWNGQSHSLAIQNGIVNTGISPTYAVTLTPSEFYMFSQTVITRNTAEALADYSAYYLTGELHQTRVN